MSVSGIWLFLAVPWVDLQCLIVVFSGRIHLRFDVTTVVCVLRDYRKEFPLTGI